MAVIIRTKESDCLNLTGKIKLLRKCCLYFISTKRACKSFSTWAVVQEVIGHGVQYLSVIVHYTIVLISHLADSLAQAEALSRKICLEIVFGCLHLGEKENDSAEMPL